MFDPALPGKIIHQTQDKDFDCLITCAAMVSGHSYYDILHVIDRLGLSVDSSITVEHLKKILSRYAILVENVPLRKEPKYGLYIETLPNISINKIVNSCHSIVVDRRDTVTKVYDPYKGRDGKYYYSSLKYGDSSVFYNESAVYSRLRMIDCNVI